MVIPEQARSCAPIELEQTLTDERAALRALLEQRRPAWIPDSVGEDYDRDPYAYQTKRELMPEGADHNDVATDQIGSALRPYVAARGWHLFGDTYIIYAPSARFRKHRIAPDMFISRKPILAPNREYALYDIEESPLAVFEVTSPDTGEQDRAKQRVYAMLEIPLFVIVDIVDMLGQPRKQYKLEVRHLSDHGGYELLAPASGGKYQLHELGLTMHAEGHNIVFTVANTNERLLPSVEMADARTIAEQRAQNEAKMREAAKLRVMQLMSEVARLRNGDKERAVSADGDR